MTTLTYKCPMCPETFQDAADVYFHVQKVHRGNKRIIKDSNPVAKGEKEN